MLYLGTTCLLQAAGVDTVVGRRQVALRLSDARHAACFRKF